MKPWLQGPQRHILNAARHLAYHQRHHSPNDYARVNHLARRAAATLEKESRTGQPTMWLQVAIYLTERHTYTAMREDRAHS